MSFLLSHPILAMWTSFSFPRTSATPGRTFPSWSRMAVRLALSTFTGYSGTRHYCLLGCFLDPLEFGFISASYLDVFHVLGVPDHSSAAPICMSIHGTDLLLNRLPDYSWLCLALLFLPHSRHINRAVECVSYIGCHANSRLAG